MTVGWDGWARWWCETGRSWGYVWTRPVSTFGQTGDGGGWRCGRLGFARVQRMPVVHLARSDASTASSSIPVTRTCTSNSFISAVSNSAGSVGLIQEMCQSAGCINFYGIKCINYFFSTKNKLHYCQLKYLQLWLNWTIKLKSVARIKE